MPDRIDDQPPRHGLSRSAPDEPATPGDSLGAFGALLLDAGYAVSDVAATMRETADARSLGAVVGVLPQAVLVEAGDGPPGTRLTPATGDTLTFDQVGRTGRLVADARRGHVPWPRLAERVARIRADPRLRPAWIVLLGSGCMSCGVSVVFGARWWSLVADALLGVLVGALIVGASRWLRIAQILPFVCALLVTVLLLAAADLAGADRVPLFAVCAPLVVLIPGATVTNAVIELSAGDVVSGGGRLISGLVVWALLAAGIGAGVALLGAQISGTAIIGVGAPTGTEPGWWGAPVPESFTWPATALVGVGVGLFASASARLTAVIVGALLLTYALVVRLQPELGTVVATGAAAAIVLAATRTFEALAPDYPSIVVFRPAYWLLVPGSFGLVALTAADADPIVTTFGTVIALTVGTQVGAILAEAAGATVRAVRTRTRID